MPTKKKTSKKKVNRNPKRHSADPCWNGYEQVGMKKKSGRKVPNCVPKGSSKTKLKRS